MTASAPPNEWPTSRYGLGSPAARNSAWRSFARVEKVAVPAEGRSRPVPNGHTLADSATWARWLPSCRPRHRARRSAPPSCRLRPNNGAASERRRPRPAHRPHPTTPAESAVPPKPPSRAREGSRRRPPCRRHDGPTGRTRHGHVVDSRRDLEVEQVRVDVSVGAVIVAVGCVSAALVGEQTSGRQAVGDSLGGLEGRRRIAGVADDEDRWRPGGGDRLECRRCRHGPVQAGKCEGPHVGAAQLGQNRGGVGGLRGQRLDLGRRGGMWDVEAVDCEVGPRSIPSTKPWANIAKRFPSPRWPWAIAS